MREGDNLQTHILANADDITNLIFGQHIVGVQMWLSIDTELSLYIIYTTSNIYYCYLCSLPQLSTLLLMVTSQLYNYGIMQCFFDRVKNNLRILKLCMILCRNNNNNWHIRKLFLSNAGSVFWRWKEVSFGCQMISLFRILKFPF